jgi:uncharacterized protein
MKEKLAIIGTGISGMSAAYFLKDKYELTIFDKADYIGGHTNTITVPEGVSFDTGFMVFNEVTYPLLTKLFSKLQVETYDTDMSFSVRYDKRNLEFNGSSLLNGIFAQRKNLFSPRYWRFVLKINEFNAKAPSILEDASYDGLDVESFVKKENLGEDFLHWFLIPMSSAVWSTPPFKIKKFPIKALVRFFYNHGFLGLDTQHQWKTVKGGSRSYRDKLISGFKDKIRLNSPVSKVERKGDKVIVVVKGEEHSFDKVIMSSHADESLKMLTQPTSNEEKLLSKFKYQENMATVHTDESLLPRLKRNWSSWNFVQKDGVDFTVYYMNRLQNLGAACSYLVNINGEEFIDPKKIIRQIRYHHPLFDVEAWQAQKDLTLLNQNGPIYYSGAYFRYGFHEDGLLSSVNLCQQLLSKEVL